MSAPRKLSGKELSELVSTLPPSAPGWLSRVVDALRSHLAAVEAERDALRAELSRLKPSGQVAEDEHALRSILFASDNVAWDNHDGLKEAQALVSRLAAKAQAHDVAVADGAALLTEGIKALCMCHGTGTYLPSCRLCDDSGEDHECPGPRACDHSLLPDAFKQPHPGAALLEELETLRQQRAMFDEAATALYGYTEFIGPCVHGRDPWDRCDDCGEGTSVAAAQKVIVKMAEEHRKALVRARNEGLERAARKVEEADDGVPLQMLADDGIRAMKEPEQ